MSLNWRPKGVNSGKAVWQVAQGCPVCLAKEGTADAVGVSIRVAAVKEARTNVPRTMQAVLGKWLMPQDNAPGMRKRCCTLIMLPPDDGTTRVPASPVCPLRLYQLMLRSADSTEMESARNAILATKCLSCVKSTTSAKIAVGLGAEQKWWSDWRGVRPISGAELKIVASHSRNGVGVERRQCVRRFQPHVPQVRAHN